MSFAAAHQSRRVRQSCVSCRERKARFRSRGEVRADRDHTLCFECFRRERERCRARGLDGRARLPLEVPAPSPFDVVASRVTLTARQISHRQAMLANMALQVMGS